MLRGHYTSALVHPTNPDFRVASSNYAWFGIDASDYNALDDRMRAIYRLWCAAASEVKIKHPHPRTYVHHHVTPGYKAVRIRMACAGLPDNDDHDRQAGHSNAGPWGSSFGLLSYVKDWPGYEVARMYLLAGYAILQLHESMETCWYEKPEKWVKGTATYEELYDTRIIHPHYDSLKWHHLDLLEKSDSGDFQVALTHLIGADEARRVISRNAARAKTDLENEIAAGSFD